MITYAQRINFQPFTLDDIREHEREWVNLVRQVRTLTQDYHRHTRRGDPAAADRTKAALRELGDSILYAHDQWVRRGQWRRYYRVLPDGVVHSSLACRSISIHTRLQCLPELVGLPLKEVAANNTVCRHCCRRSVSPQAQNKTLQKYLLVN